MNRMLPSASHSAAFASTLPPASDHVMTIPSDISTFMTVLLFPGLVDDAPCVLRSVAESPREFTPYADELCLTNS